MCPTAPTARDVATRADPLIGCAGWSLPRETWPRFSAVGTHLERYASRFAAVEINSSFYRSHRPATYTRWAASVPAAFRFAVKLPKTITHVLRLRQSAAPLAEFLAQVESLGSRLGCLLVQLPPSLDFDRAVALAFFGTLREHFAGGVACEPRHPSWFQGEVDTILAQLRIARVAADPAPVPRASEPGGWNGLVYHRLHGSPQMYYSAYSDQYLDRLAARLANEVSTGVPVWCIFDNTANGAATLNGLSLLERVRQHSSLE
jgi:uncharacterized protein YecE (DUF72 family)